VVVKGTFFITQKFLQLNDKATGLTIINITSAAAINVTPGLSSYSLSKLCQIQLQSFVVQKALVPAPSACILAW
jgi:NAD(P)-dependent dehydrogenase (short-subunit alcohol dehydrogenase family)